MERIRTPFQGISNIIRFNWHFYVIAFVGSIALMIAGFYFPGNVQLSAYVLCGLIILSTVISLMVSYYVYDRSGLYRFSWLKPFVTGKEPAIANINAGFDETSPILQHLFPDAILHVFDFYDPDKHTEISIKRARAAYPSYPATQPITTDHLPLDNGSVDLIFLIFAAHEIRNDEERALFFKELHRKLENDGRIIIVEHLRDAANFLAYNIGFFHFHSLSTWRKTFARSGFTISNIKKINPFVSLLILEKT